MTVGELITLPVSASRAASGPAASAGRPGAVIAWPVPSGLPRWDEPHHCGSFAAHVHTRSEKTVHGVAVWLVQECAVCGRLWDVLSEESSEGVLVASVFPVWAVKSCGLCCAGECLASPDCCPCHIEPAGGEW